MQKFSDAGLPLLLAQSLEGMKFTTPTPIQAKAIPIALEGNDILASAQTGTGKTGAFGIPLVTKLLTTPRGSALVLTPTRELAVQVHDALRQMIGKSRIASALLIGGESMPKQFKQLKMRPRLIVGTPGRINDHLERGTLMLHDTNFLVLDETDRMLDLGFGVQLERIAKYLTAKRQTLMFSATLPANIVKLSNKYLIDPVRIAVGSTTSPAKKITQEIIHVTDGEKYTKLLDQLDARTGSIIVFVKTKRGADRLATKLNRQTYSAEAIHGDLRQSKRDRVISDFRNRKHRILIATDVAARGLDIPHIEHVINYDLPQCPEDYIHRIGRTARAGAEGTAVCLISPHDGVKWKAIQKLMNPGAHQASKPSSKKPSRKRRSFGGKPGGGKKFGGRPGNTSNGGKSGGTKKPFHAKRKPGGSAKPHKKHTTLQRSAA